MEQVVSNFAVKKYVFRKISFFAKDQIAYSIFAIGMLVHLDPGEQITLPARWLSKPTRVIQ